MWRAYQHRGVGEEIMKKRNGEKRHRIKRAIAGVATNGASVAAASKIAASISPGNAGGGGAAAA